MPLPTFVIVGAQKCGTTSLHRMLRQHPQVHMSRTKELHFFDRHFDRGRDWYAAQFTPTRQHRHSGETTPSYMYLEDARKRLIATLPDAKIVMILRNPIDRAYSHYWHDVRRLEQKRRTQPVPESFEAALAQERPALMPQPAGAGGDAAGQLSYLGRGEYLDQIEPFAAAYGRDRLHVMLLEDLLADRTAALRGLFRFLGVRKRQAESVREVHVNRYRRPDESGQVKAAEYRPMGPETRAVLVEHFTPHNERLGAWLGRDLSHWR